MQLSRTGFLPRTDHVRDATLCVVATEGTHTEKQYLEGLFGSLHLKLEVLSTGETGRSAPNHVLARLVDFNRKYDLGPDDERWLMVDVDHNQPQVLSSLCQEAKQRGFGLAVSNPCFEMWLWLHFADPDPADTTCQQLESHLRSTLGSYNKSNLDVSHYTPERIADAIGRAKSLPHNPAQPWPDFPGTHVYQLVEHLLPHLRFA